jgi:cystathionine gamma-synthase
MTDPNDELAFETRAVHAGQEPDPQTGAVTVPIYQTSTFAQDGVGQHRGYEYARTGNPTRTALETAMASLEEGAHGLAFASGMAAEDAILRLLASGDHVVLPNDAYGGTWRLVARVHAAAGLGFTAVDLTSPPALEEAWTPATRLVWVESPTNPMLSVIDIAAVAAFAHGRGALVVVDNTFATPYYQRPLVQGADIVVHSSTKYLGGHSDVVGGVAVTNDAEVAERLAFLQNAVGAVPGPLDCYLVLRGLKTLAVRMDRHTQNAQHIAAFLEGQQGVAKVLYPGFGGMVSFLAAGGEDAAVRICESTTLFTLAESLGAVESLIEHPARMTHLSVAGSTNAVDPSLVRLSIGIEHVDDLIADLAQALARL